MYFVLIFRTEITEIFFINFYTKFKSNKWVHHASLLKHAGGSGDQSLRLRYVQTAALGEENHTTIYSVMFVWYHSAKNFRRYKIMQFVSFFCNASKYVIFNHVI